MGFLSKTTSEIEEALEKADNIETTFDTLFTQKMLSIYPVGAIYMSASSTSPASLFGGTWEQIQNRFLLAAGSSYTAGKTGGAKTVTLTENQIPSHAHTFKNGSYTWLWGVKSGLTTPVSIPGANASAQYATSNELITDQGVWNGTNNTGGGKSHNNMPPYLVVYVWKRTA